MTGGTGQRRGDVKEKVAQSCLTLCNPRTIQSMGLPMGLQNRTRLSESFSILKSIMNTVSLGSVQSLSHVRLFATP